jgi:5-methylcytosine-specific restriction endonuclease McrA
MGRVLNDEQKKARAEYQKAWREANKERLAEWHREYRKNNPDKNKTNTKAYRELHPDKAKESTKKYKANNQDKVKAASLAYRGRKLELHNIKKANDPVYNLKCTIRSSILKSFSRINAKKNNKTVEILGCSYEFLREHIESKFETWMTWDNKGLYNGELNYGWDVDHIIPLDTAVTEEDVIRLNHYTNLQPLCSKINRDIKKNNPSYY